MSYKLYCDQCGNEVTSTQWASEKRHTQKEEKKITLFECRDLVCRGCISGAVNNLPY